MVQQSSYYGAIFSQVFWFSQMWVCVLANAKQPTVMTYKTYY